MGFSSIVGDIANVATLGLLDNQDALFGTAPSATTSQAGTFTDEQKEVERLLGEFLQSGGGSVAGNIPGTGGVAPLSNLQQLSITGIEGLLNDPIGAASSIADIGSLAESRTVADPTSPTSAAPSSALTAAGQGIEDIIGGDAANFEDFFRTNVLDPSIKTFREDITPAISTRFADQFFGSARRDADKSANEDLIESLTRSRSDLAFRTDQANRADKLSAIGLAPSQARTEFDTQIGQPANIELAQLAQQLQQRGFDISQSGQAGDFLLGGRGQDVQQGAVVQEGQQQQQQLQLQQLLAAFGVGGDERQVDQATLSADFDEFVRQEQIRQQRAKLLNAFLGNTGVENITTVDPGSAGLISSFLGGAGAGIGASIF